MTNRSKIWMDGKLVNWDDANVHILTHGLHYGGGVFEGIRIYNTDKGRRSSGCGTTWSGSTTRPRSSG